MSDFLVDHGVVVALLCAGLAVLYGVLTTRSLLALSPGNERMVEISKAVQEGASAYLRRQYTTIGIVGVVLFVVLIPLQSIAVAVGFAIGGLLSASAGFIGMNVSVRANCRVADLLDVGSEPRLDERQERARAFDREAHLLEVGLLAVRGRQPGATSAEVQQRDDGLDEDVVDANARELGLVGGAQLLVGVAVGIVRVGRRRGLAGVRFSAHAGTSWA